MDEEIEAIAIQTISDGKANGWTFAELRAETAYQRRYTVTGALISARIKVWGTDRYFGTTRFSRIRARIIRRIRSGELID